MSEYVIWSDSKQAWWRPNSQGYTKDLNDAGRYSATEAMAICERSLHWADEGFKFNSRPLGLDLAKMFANGQIKW